MPENQKELSLVKGQDRFVFHYQPGSEEDILDAFVNMAHDRKTDFDWFDAAVLSFQLSKHLVEEADALLAPQTWSHESSAGNSNSFWECS